MQAKTIGVAMMC